MSLPAELGYLHRGYQGATHGAELQDGRELIRDAGEYNGQHRAEGLEAS